MAVKELVNAIIDTSAALLQQQQGGVTRVLHTIQQEKENVTAKILAMLQQELRKLGMEATPSQVEALYQQIKGAAESMRQAEDLAVYSQLTQAVVGSLFLDPTLSFRLSLYYWYLMQLRQALLDMREALLAIDEFLRTQQRFWETPDKIKPADNARLCALVQQLYSDITPEHRKMLKAYIEKLCAYKITRNIPTDLSFYNAFASLYENFLRTYTEVTFYAGLCGTFSLRETANTQPLPSRLTYHCPQGAPALQRARLCAAAYAADPAALATAWRAIHQRERNPRKERRCLKTALHIRAWFKEHPVPAMSHLTPDELFVFGKGSLRRARITLRQYQQWIETARSQTTRACYSYPHEVHDQLIAKWTKLLNSLNEPVRMALITAVAHMDDTPLWAAIKGQPITNTLNTFLDQLKAALGFDVKTLKRLVTTPVYLFKDAATPSPSYAGLNLAYENALDKLTAYYQRTKANMETLAKSIADNRDTIAAAAAAAAGEEEE